MLMVQDQEPKSLRGCVWNIPCTKKVFNKPLTIVGDGNQTRDFVFVKDLVEALYLGAKSNLRKEIFNLGSGKETKVNQIAKLIGGKTVKIPKRPGEPDRSLAGIKKIKNKLNWKPKHSLESEVKIMLKNINN